MEDGGILLPLKIIIEELEEISSYSEETLSQEDIFKELEDLEEETAFEIDKLNLLEIVAEEVDDSNYGMLLKILQAPEFVDKLKESDVYEDLLEKIQAYERQFN
jgi:hypothetical protein